MQYIQERQITYEISTIYKYQRIENLGQFWCPKLFFNFSYII